MPQSPEAPRQSVAPPIEEVQYARPNNILAPSVSKMPWFPFWVDDFLSSPKVRRMDATEVGIYVLLLCEQHQSDGSLIRDTPEDLAKMFRTEPADVANVLSLCFKSGTRGGYYNTRLRSINLGQADISRKRSDAAKARHSKGISANAEQLHSKSSANQNQSQNTKKNSKKKTRLPETQLPDNWVPQESHIKKASECSLDVVVEAESFRLHHGSKQSLYRDWDLTFHTWLRNAVKFGLGSKGKKVSGALPRLRDVAEDMGLLP